MARFEEGLEVITRLLRSNEPVTYEGRFYHLHGAILLPQPGHPGSPRIMIGGNGTKRTLPLVARYADVWNGVFISASDFHKRSRRLDTLLREAGRQPEDVRRTAMTSVFFGRDREELDRRLSWRHANAELGNLSLDEVVAKLPATGKGVAGTPDMLIEQIRAYERAGAEEMMLQWLEYEDADGIAAFAKNVLPHL
jgi:alkanesulfonate monooxygenase SsuD/methylene tetrahydromethanopterin reductase-like flavin-dependent oxidoreductase (luciferase family)